MNINIPYYQPQVFNPGFQIYNPGTGGPKSHMAILAAAPKTWPTIYAIRVPGIGAMPRQVIGPTLPIIDNAFSNPPLISNLEIAGLYKPPFGSQLG